uniref:Secreted protein n=1 Tax=Amblyomma triste TaxID=251400 RepID=A0A023G4W8_AMBTT
MGARVARIVTWLIPAVSAASPHLSTEGTGLSFPDLLSSPPTPPPSLFSGLASLSLRSLCFYIVLRFFCSSFLSSRTHHRRFTPHNPPLTTLFHDFYFIFIFFLFFLRCGRHGNIGHHIMHVRRERRQWLPGCSLKVLPLPFLCNGFQ